MSLVLLKDTTAMAAGNLTCSVGASGGTAPYVFSLATGGPGGSIDPASGVYTAPITAPSDPAASVETIIVTDAASATASGQILVTTPLGLFCEVLQQELTLAPGRVYLWDQKLFQPEDNGLYIAVSVARCKPFSNTNFQDGGGSGLDSVQSVNMLALIDLDIISRGTEALFRKEEVIMALNSNYAQSQCERNSFFIGQLPAGAQFTNLSNIDGAAIPYRYRISVAMQYFVIKRKPVPYFSSFQTPEIFTNP